MLVCASPALRAVVLSAAFASVGGAQATKACEVNESRPSALGKAAFMAMTASSAQTPEAAKKQLLGAMKQLVAVGDKTDNIVGKNFVYGKVLVLWAMQPGIGLDPKRGAIGLLENPDANVDIALSLDSAFKVVETEMPECVSETVKWRGQKPWVDQVNKAIERLNAEDADSASLAAQRAITLNPFAPYGYVVLANVKQRQQRTTEAFALYRKSVELAAKDTISGARAWHISAGWPWIRLKPRQMRLVASRTSIKRGQRSKPFSRTKAPLMLPPARALECAASPLRRVTRARCA